MLSTGERPTAVTPPPGKMPSASSAPVPAVEAYAVQSVRDVAEQGGSRPTGTLRTRTASAREAGAHGACRPLGPAGPVATITHWSGDPQGSASDA